MAKKGDWVRIHAIVLKADERTAKLPSDNAKMQIWKCGQKDFCRKRLLKSAMKLQ